MVINSQELEVSEIKDILNKYIPDVEQGVKDSLVNTPDFIGGVINYHFGWADQNFQPANFDRGKALRPIVCLMVFEALTGNRVDALPAAVSIELIHNFSLIHDDIEDGDIERRGRPTAWTIWGKPLAINVGDYLYTLAFRNLHNLDVSKFGPEKVLAVQRLITDACITLTEGQDLDLRFEQMQNVSTEMYLDMVYKKTGALLEAAIVAGATLGTSDQEIIDNYQKFAHNIGVAFQIRDDILGIWGDAAKTGKSIDNDLRRKKKTLPVLYMLGKASGERKEKLATLYASADQLTDSQIEFVRDNLAWADAHTYAQNAADTYIKNAFTALNQTGINTQPQQDLESIAKYLVERSH